MAITASGTFTVTDQAPTTVASSISVLPPLGFNAGGRGKLTHPTLGAYEYATAPTEVVNLDGDVCFPPIHAHTQTIGGGVDTVWPGYIRDAKVIEIWKQGEVGCPIEHLRMIWNLFINAPPLSGPSVIWEPNYINAQKYNVLITAVRSGDRQTEGQLGWTYSLDLRLARYGYAPLPVELEMRILGYAS